MVASVAPVSLQNVRSSNQDPEWLDIRKQVFSNMTHPTGHRYMGELGLATESKRRPDKDGATIAAISTRDTTAIAVWKTLCKIIPEELLVYNEVSAELRTYVLLLQS